MPVLMNKGSDPRKAAWLFYTDRAELDEWGRTIVEGRWDCARLTVDEDELAAAKKASSPVGVWAQAKTLIPEDFDLEKARGEVMDRAQAALERAQQQADEQAAGDGLGDAGADGEAEKGNPEQDSEGEQGSPETDDTTEPGGDAGVDGEGDPFDYEPIEAPAGLRVRVGTTTRQAAQDYLAGRDGQGEEGEGAQDASDTDLPGLQMLAQLIDYMRDSSEGLPSFAVWHIDQAGILRMVRAKKLKAMAGNVLSVKS